MDQTASSVGDTVAIDFANPEAPVVRPIEANLEGLGLALCIIDCGADSCRFNRRIRVHSTGNVSGSCLFREKSAA